MENDNSLLIIYDGGSEQAEMIANLNSAMNGTKISKGREISSVLTYLLNHHICARLPIPAGKGSP